MNCFFHCKLLPKYNKSDSRFITAPSMRVMYVFGNVCLMPLIVCAHLVNNDVDDYFRSRGKQPWQNWP